MNIYHSIKDLHDDLRKHRDLGLTIGFVPTMGALHMGHLSLVEYAKKHCNIVVTSIFVNPAQFNEASDLNDYPRTPESDISMLEKAGCNGVFIPMVSEIYPDDFKPIKNVNYGLLTSSLEGEKRPGHFDGVVTVVKRLFDIVEPNMAFFGLKDFQQFSIIKRMVVEFDMNIEVIACPIIREESGLARSSRNELLSPEDREFAAVLSKTLFKMAKKSSDKRIKNLKKYGLKKLSKSERLELEYLEFVDPTTFERKKPKDKSKNTVVLLAARIGGVRLIDNILL